MFGMIRSLLRALTAGMAASTGGFAVTLLAVAIVAPSSASANPTGKPILHAGQILAVGEYLVAPNGQFFVMMQDDGNLVVYRGSGPSNQQGAIWASAQVGHYPHVVGAYYAVMQNDGNFAIYRGAGPSFNQGFVWGTVQSGHYSPGLGNYFAVIQNDGNFVVYRGTGLANNSGPVWGSLQSVGR